MKEMLVLIIGGTGLIGARLFEKARGAFDVRATYHNHIVRSQSFHKLEIADQKAVENLVEEISPGAVVNTAAVHQMDKCETDRNAAKTVNLDAAVHLAEACGRIGAHFVYLSTEYVFDGTKTTPYSETDERNPLSYYGETKAEAEKAILGMGGDSLIVRTSTVYGWNETKHNFATWALGELEAGRSVNGAEDRIGSPTYVEDLADAVVKAIEMRKTGIYHIAGREPMDRYNFALNIAETFGLNPRLVKPVKSSSLGQKAKRPTYAPLDVRKAEAELGVRMRPPKEGLAEMARGRA